LRFDFGIDGILKVSLKVFDAEIDIEDGEVLDQFLLDEIELGEYSYYGKKLSLQFKHPYFPDDYNIYVDVSSYINE
jgi:hypothetical protein